MAGGSFLDGIRVLEVADELGEYCGRVFAGLGADVVKVEPPDGELTRSYGPFYHDQQHPDRSLYFWHYNWGKRSCVLDLESAEGQDSFRRLASVTDIVIDARHRGWMAARGIGYEILRELNPRLIYVRISPFGDDGPWSDFEGSDLVHLALGGVMMNCGYDPDPMGTYDTPPISPQMWHAYQICGEMAAMSAIAALEYRLRSDKGQLVAANVHDAVSKNTETDMPDWVFLRQPHYRRTGRHSGTSERVTDQAGQSRTKDGRWLMPWRVIGMTGFPDAFFGTVRLLKKYGMESVLADPKYDNEEYRRSSSEAIRLFASSIDNLVSAFKFDRDLWLEAQAEGLPWAPVRRPEENVLDEHWRARETFIEVEHPELGETFTYVGAKWFCPQVPWPHGPRPPLLGEHSEEVLVEWGERAPIKATHLPPASAEMRSVRGRPFSLAGVRVVDLSWQLASAGAGRFLAAFGAEVIKVEHETRWDGMRWAAIATSPPGGRAERDAAVGPIAPPAPDGPNRSGTFAEINSGKLGISVDLKSQEGRQVLEELIRSADIVVEGFSPGTMDRMGFGYERLKEINPDIIYAQQSGLGQYGTYGRMRTFGPIAAAITGLTDMSGLPEPYQPAGWGYSYLDWFGAYNLATAMLAALYRRDVSGKGCWIDSSQGETGTSLTGTAVLDYSANGRNWQRYGNRSPYKSAAPHGAFPTAGTDRWIAIACFTQAQWEALAEALSHREWLADERFATLEGRLADQDELERLIGQATFSREGYELMDTLQASHIPAGVCQTAQDRFENDPQLAHLNWLVELEQAEIGTWPIKEHPVALSETPADIGGIYHRSGPSYGQDTDFILGQFRRP